jgi:hypothetical protein
MDLSTAKIDQPYLHVLLETEAVYIDLRATPDQRCFHLDANKAAACNCSGEEYVSAVNIPSGLDSELNELVAAC